MVFIILLVNYTDNYKTRGDNWSYSHIIGCYKKRIDAEKCKYQKLFEEIMGELIEQPGLLTKTYPPEWIELYNDLLRRYGKTDKYGTFIDYREVIKNWDNPISDKAMKLLDNVAEIVFEGEYINTRMTIDIIEEKLQ